MNIFRVSYNIEGEIKRIRYEKAKKKYGNEIS